MADFCANFSTLKMADLLNATHNRISIIFLTMVFAPLLALLVARDLRNIASVLISRTRVFSPYPIMAKEREFGRNKMSRVFFFLSCQEMEIKRLTFPQNILSGFNCRFISTPDVMMCG